MESSSVYKKKKEEYNKVPILSFSALLPFFDFVTTAKKEGQDLDFATSSSPFPRTFHKFTEFYTYVQTWHAGVIPSDVIHKILPFLTKTNQNIPEKVNLAYFCTKVYNILENGQ